MKFLSMSSALFALFLNTSKCSESPKKQVSPPFTVGTVYVEQWSSPIRSGGSGFHIFIPLEQDGNNQVVLDSVYFRNQGTKLIKRETDSVTMYIGQFLNPQKTKGDLIMSSDPMEEMKNNTPTVLPDIPFELEYDECMVSYSEGESVKYHLIQDVVEKQSDTSPRATPKRQ